MVVCWCSAGGGAGGDVDGGQSPIIDIHFGASRSTSTDSHLSWRARCVKLVVVSRGGGNNCAKFLMVAGKLKRNMDENTRK